LDRQIIAASHIKAMDEPTPISPPAGAPVAHPANALPQHSRLSRLLRIAIVAVLVAILFREWLTELPPIGAATTVTELTSGATLSARIDTGATMCSIHCEEILPPEHDEPVDGDHKLDEDARDDVGRLIRFRIIDEAGESHWIETRLVDVTYIRVGNKPRLRYCVNLPLRIAGVEATVLVTLNNRDRMKYPFLVGRNFLKDRFVVDVRADNDEIIF
jgi:hypothetical protein